MSTQPENIYTSRTRELRKAWLSGELDHSEARGFLNFETLKSISERMGSARKQMKAPGTSSSPSLKQNQPNLRLVYDQLNGRQR